MNKNKTFFTSLVLFTTFSASAQTLFTYGNGSVTKQEFLRMYTKNNATKKADMSEKALREYLQLYAKFKMKVAEADAKQMDTIPGIISELGLYKKQLAKNYLTDKDVINKLNKETYDRLKKEVNVEHIFVQIPKVANTDSLPYFRKIDSIYNALTSKKANFETLASTVSDDKPAAKNQGNIGWFTAMQIEYPFESVAYNTAVGQYSKPFRTSYGYHIIKKIAERPSQGEVQVEQILVTTKKYLGEQGKIQAKQTADSLIQKLNQGANFEELVKTNSEDKYSVNNNGELPAFGIGSVAQPIEKAAFALTKIGDYTKQPIETDYGFHILKLIKKTSLKPFDEYKAELAKRIERDGRVQIAQAAFLNKIKTKNNFTETPGALQAIQNAIPDSASNNGKLHLENIKYMNKPMFSLKNTVFTQADFINYLQANTRGMIYGEKNYALKTQYNTFVEKTLMDYEENNMANENQEFKTLLQEYKDGIMLFELTDKNVWGKASSDTIGLQKYFKENASKYTWGPSFEGTVIKCTTEKAAKDFTELVKTKKIEEAITALNKDQKTNVVNIESGKFEFEKIDPSAKNTSENTYSNYTKTTDGNYTLIYPTKINLQNSPKQLNEAKGYVIADYQEYLEKSWIKNLDEKYPVKVNEQVFKSMIGK